MRLCRRPSKGCYSASGDWSGIDTELDIDHITPHVIARAVVSLIHACSSCRTLITAPVRSGWNACGTHATPHTVFSGVAVARRSTF